MRRLPRFGFGLWLVLPLVVALLHPALAVTVSGIAKIAHRLEHKTNVVVRLPTYVPDSLTAEEVYATVASVSRRGYVVRLATRPNCPTARSCFIGTIGGFSRAPSMPRGYATRLRDGTAATAGPSELVWKRDATWYRLRIFDASAYSIKMMAMSLRRF